MVLAVLIVALLVVPLVELYVIIQVGDWIGFFPTFALLIIISIVGAFLVKREGLNTWRRAQAQLRAGELPAGELIDGALIVVAGVMLLTPGFVTDALGALLLLPAMRYFPRRWARRHAAVRTGNVVYGRVIDVRGTGGPEPSPEDPPMIDPPAPR